MTPLDDNPLLSKKTRKRRTKGTFPQRSSRRCKGVEPSFLDLIPKAAALKKLELGGAAGRRQDAIEKRTFSEKR